MIRWRGFLAKESVGTRNAGLALLLVMGIAMVSTQLAYVVVGGVHLMPVLGVVCVAAASLGPILGGVVGAVVGLVQLMHAWIFPLDVYESYFRAPSNSVLILVVLGVVMGMLFGHVAVRERARTWKRPACLAACCLGGSLVYSVMLAAGTYLINTLLAASLPTRLVEYLSSTGDFWPQVVGNFVLMSAFVIGNDLLVLRRESHTGNRSIRETFQGWLLVVILMGYMVVASVSYTFVSAACRNQAEEQMQGQLDYLQGQLSDRSSIISALVRRAGLSAQGEEEVHAATITGVAQGMELGEGGMAIVADDGVIVSTNLEGMLGQSFEEVVGAGLANGFDESLYKSTTASDWVMEDGEMGYARVAQMAYVRVVREGSYQLMVAMPASAVYRNRTITMAILSLSFLIVFILMYRLASVLLREVVVKGFDRTNESLGRIMGGDLDEVVDVRSSTEFEHLSYGINSTVGSLKESLEETREAIERELATARAIQTSALPTAFPPFPEVDKFDIYASMDAAKEVGGDFYDFFLIDDHKLGFLIADVSGKGIPAALFMMAAKTEIANYLQSGISVSDAIETANSHLCMGNDENMFVTMWAAVLDYETGVLEFVNAGHNPPLLRHDGEWKWIRERSGPFLGAMDGIPYRGHALKMAKNDMLFLYTDGVSESCDPVDELYGEDRLEALLARHVTSHPRVVSTAVRRDLEAWASGAEQSDDITMLALEYGVACEVTDELEVPAQTEMLDKVLSFVHAELGRRLCPISAQNQLDIALEELFVNVCRYAYPEREDGLVWVRYVYTSNPSALTVEITDEGVPFDPVGGSGRAAFRTVEEAQVGGLGIFMAKRAVDDMAYVRDGDRNVVSFVKRW